MGDGTKNNIRRSHHYLLPSLFIFAIFPAASSALLPPRSIKQIGFRPTDSASAPAWSRTPLTTSFTPSSPTVSAMELRGGASATVLTDAVISAASSLSTALETGSGPAAVGALFAVSSLTVVPLTLYKLAYSYSVGYGFSVAAMAGALLGTFAGLDPAPAAINLTYAALFYGLRLAGHLLLREVAVPGKSKQIEDNEKTPRLKRIPLGVGVGLFYAFMMTPALYALRSEPVFLPKLAVVGTGLAWVGAALEGVADLQKFLAKRSDDGVDNKAFMGPTGGVYRICRHPNYLGEVLFWLGTFLGGAPSFGKSPVLWICSSLGLYGIVSIMRSATKRLEGKQKEKYGGQEKYDTWVADVKSPLVPFFN